MVLVAFEFLCGNLPFVGVAAADRAFAGMNPAEPAPLPHGVGLLPQDLGHLDGRVPFLCRPAVGQQLDKHVELVLDGDLTFHDGREPSIVPVGEPMANFQISSVHMKQHLELGQGETWT